MKCQRNIITLKRWLTVIPGIPAVVLMLMLNEKKETSVSLWDSEHKLSHNVLVIIVEKLI